MKAPSTTHRSYASVAAAVATCSKQFDKIARTNGKSIGRVEEVRAVERGQAAVVSGVCIGPRALLERLSAPVMSLVGRQSGYLARMDQIDLSDPLRPRLLVPVSELESL